MAQQVQRWIEVTPSQFPHEAEGLNIVRSLLPDNAPFRAWSNLEFRDGQGKWHEVDLLVLGRRRLHLVELKYYAGTLRGDDLTWRREGHRAEDSPLKLARRKAQRLASKLRDELVRTGRRRPAHAIPIPATSCHSCRSRCSCTIRDCGACCRRPSRIDLFGLDGSENETGLPGISERLLEPATPHQSVGANRDEIIAALMARIGVVQRRQREAGSWVIDEEPLGRRRRLAGLAGLPPRGDHRPGPDPVPGHPARDHLHDPGEGAPGRRARVPHHVPAGQRPAAAPPGHGRQRPRRRPGVPAGREVPAARPVAGRPGRPGPGRRPARRCCGRLPRRWRTRTATGSSTAA